MKRRTFAVGIAGGSRAAAGGMLASAVYGPALAAAATLTGPARVAVAAGFSALDVESVALVGTSVPLHRETTFLSLRTVGGIVGPTLVGALVAVFEYGVVFAAAGAVATAVVVAAALPDAPLDGPPDAAPRVETTVSLHHPTPGGPDDD